MGFFKASLALAGALTTLVSGAAIQKRDACSTGKWVGPDTIGGNGGGPICETQWGGTYQPISALSVWTDNVRIRGIQATYSDGTVSKIYGQTDDTATGSIKVDYSKGDRFTTVTSYGNGVGTELGHLYMEASNGQKLDIGKSTSGITPYQQNVGGGILLGLIGNSGSDIDALGFLFISSDISSVQVGDMQFSNPPTGSNDMSPVILSQQHYYNDQSSGNVSWSFTGQQTQQSSTTYTMSTTETFGGSISLEIDAELFGIGAKETDEFNWQVSTSQETATTTSNGINLSWQEGGSLAPGKGVDCTASVQKGEGNFDYSATVTIHLKDGTDYTYSEKGTLANTAYSEAYVSTKDDDSNTTPPGISQGSVSSPSSTASSSSSSST